MSNKETMKEIIQDLQTAFPKSIINSGFEFVANPHPRVNTYFRLEDCETLLDVKCKVLAYMSRPAYKSEPFHVKHLNREVHEYHLDGINTFLGTDFTEDDMEIIYTYLGNDVNRPLCIKFIESGYDLNIIKEHSDE